MSTILRSLIVIVLSLVSCAATAAALVFYELRTGHPLYSFSVAQYVPVGAIGAGLVAGLGYYLASRMLRLRPAVWMLAAIALLAAASVFLLDTVEYGFFAIDRTRVTDAASFERFMTYSVANSPLKFWPSGSDSEGQASSAAPAARPMASVAGDSNAGVEGIGSGVSGMMATGSAVSADNMSSTFSGAQQHIAGAQALASSVLSHQYVLVMAALQFAGFLLGSLLAYSHLRSIDYCESCSLFLKKKGSQTRYFDTSRTMQGAVDQFLSTIKGRLYRQSIESHAAEGTAKATKFSSFESTVEVSRCKGCAKHRVRFSARRKENESWKDIRVLDYTTFCLEPVNVVKG